MHSVMKCAKQCMQGAQGRSKIYVDLKRIYKKFVVSQKVFLKEVAKC